MKEEKKQTLEHVEAIPGPAIVISRETYKRMQESNNQKQNQHKLKKYETFFKSIKDETKMPENDDELTL